MNPSPAEAPDDPVEGPFRWGYFALAWIFFGLGAVGVVLPVLPTTPFMLLALWGFARSSRRFHGWLYEHPTFGPPLRTFAEHRVIPTGVKILAITTMGFSFVALVLLGRVPWFGLVATGALMAIGIAYISSFPGEVSGGPEREPDPRENDRT